MNCEWVISRVLPLFKAGLMSQRKPYVTVNRGCDLPRGPDRTTIHFCEEKAERWIGTRADVAKASRVVENGTWSRS